MRVLHIGPDRSEAFDLSSLEQQSRAVQLAGGTVVRYAGRCKGLVSFGHGYDHLDLDAATRNGVILANTASFGTEEVSNHTMMHFLVCARKFVLHDKLVRSGTWTNAASLEVV